MIVRTEEICGYLLENGFKRDTSQPYDYAGYFCNSGQFVVIDESFTYQDTDHLIQDCVANECYEGAAIIKNWVKKHTKKTKE